MMRKIMLLLLLSIANIYRLNAQDLQKGFNSPTSPEAALIKKVNDIPVSLYTGTVNVPINIFNIKEGGVSIPVTLEYTGGSGIKLDEQATWVGLGWNLTPEGSIIQEVRGVRDEFDNDLRSSENLQEYNKFYERLLNFAGGERQKVVPQKGTATMDFCIPTQGIPPCLPPQTPTDSDGNLVVTSLKYDNGQPDIYKFNFAGYSGSFFINPHTKEVVLLDKKNNINFIVQNSSIIAKAPDGTKFVFSQIETIDYLGTYSFDPHSGKNYKLTEIEFVNKKKILFEYQDASYSNTYFTQSRNIYLDGYVRPYTSCSGKINYSYTSPSSNIFRSSVKILKSIKSQDFIINFNLESREDVNLDLSYLGGTIPTINNGLKKLASIDIVNPFTNKKVQSFKFNYSYFPYSNNFPNVMLTNPLVQNNKDVFGKRLKLDSVENFTYDNSGNEVHTNNFHLFEYNLQNVLPPKISFAKDFWGYYNGVNNENLVPNLDYLVPIQTFEIPTDYSTNSGNRYSNKNVVGSYMLKKVTYPTKGYTEFEYEINTFDNQFIPSQQKIINFTTNYSLNNNGVGGYNPTNNVSTFILKQQSTIKFHNRFTGGFDGGNNIPSKRYSFYQMQSANAKIEVFKINTNENGQELSRELVQKWDVTSNNCNNNTFISNGYNNEWDANLTLPGSVDSPTKYMVIASIDNSMYNTSDTYHSAGVYTSFSTRDYSLANGVTSEGHGVRIKSIKNYDTGNQLAEWKQYEYSGGKLHNKYNIFKTKNVFCFECNSDTYCSGEVSSNTYYSILDDAVDNSHDAVGYSTVIEKIKGFDQNSNIVEKGKIEYKYKNFENYTANFFPVIKNEENGLMESQKIFDINSKSIIEKEYKYKKVGGDKKFYSVRAENRILTSSKDPVAASSGDDISAITKYMYYFTPLIAQTYKLDSLNTKQKFQNNYQITKEKYNYYSNDELSNKKTTFSDGTYADVNYYYAYEKNNQQLIDANMVGIPLETISLKNGKAVSKVETLYPTSLPTTQTGNLLLPLSVQSTRNNTISLTTPPTGETKDIELTYDQYDTKGNILQYTEKGLKPTVIIWGYNQTQPIAKIEGITYNSLMALSGVSTLVNNAITASNADVDTATEQSLITALINLRSNSNLSGYNITTYTYDPLIGVTSITSPNGMREIYKYDTANRLQSVVDMNGKILKEYQYNYKQ